MYPIQVREREAAFGAPAASAVDAEALAEALAEANRTIEETSESVGWQNFGKTLLVFGCIGSDFCK